MACEIAEALRRTPANARLLFFGSIVYLPLLWGLMIATRMTIR